MSISTVKPVQLKIMHTIFINNVFVKLNILRYQQK